VLNVQYGLRIGVNRDYQTARSRAFDDISCIRERPTFSRVCHNGRNNDGNWLSRLILAGSVGQMISQKKEHSEERKTRRRSYYEFREFRDTMRVLWDKNLPGEFVRSNYSGRGELRKSLTSIATVAWRCDSSVHPLPSAAPGGKIAR